MGVVFVLFRVRLRFVVVSFAVSLLDGGPRFEKSLNCTWHENETKQNGNEKRKTGLGRNAVSAYVQIQSDAAIRSLDGCESRDWHLATASYC